jgi:RNA polymerase sigma factor (sigma-70 family)
MAVALTEGEQNRLIQSHLDLPTEVASRYRGRKGIPFEDLIGVGMVALVGAARKFSPSGKFGAYAEKVIKFAIIDFIDAWQEFEPLDPNTIEAEKLMYEWQNLLFAIYERWEGEPHSPESLLIRFEEVASTPEIIATAFIGLSPFERKLISDYFMASPPKPLEQIARDHGKSYMHVNKIIYRALDKMREAIKNQQPKRPETNIIAFPARAGRLIKKSDRPNNQAYGE